jgi:glyoxylase-like metal-dependent hydrolase (beta-lactamase superfamily II)
MPQDTYRFSIGKFECVAVNDGTYYYTAAQYFPNAPADALAPALAAHGLDPARIASPYTCLVVDTGANLVLVDTGARGLAPGVGGLLDRLRAQGIAPVSVDTVILTHGHPDHIGGNTDGAGRLAFPNARHVMWRSEWDYWTDEAALAGLPAVFSDCARKNLGPLRDRIALVEREEEIVPGIRALAAPGHTIGQMALAIASGGDELLYISDAATHPLHLEHPDWYTVWDVDTALALRSKRRLFDLAATERTLVLAFHFPPFPGLGHVVARGDGWEWQPVAASVSADGGASG